MRDTSKCQKAVEPDKEMKDQLPVMDLKKEVPMKNRVGFLALILAGGLAVFQPAVAQAQDRGDYRHYDRHEDRRSRDWDRHEYRERAWHDRDERRDWREHERYENRYYRPGVSFYYGTAPNYYAYPYGDRCPR